MAKVVSRQGLDRTATRPLGSESRVVGLDLLLTAAGGSLFAFTPSLGDIIFLEHVWLSGHPTHDNDFMDTFTYTLQYHTRQPTTFDEAQAGEDVIPLWRDNRLRRWTFGGHVWQQDFSINKWFEGPRSIFSLTGPGGHNEGIEFLAVFQYQLSEV